MSELINIKTLDEFVSENEEMNEGIRDLLSEIWHKLALITQGSQRVFMRKLAKENNKNKKVRMINGRIEELAGDYVEGILEKGKAKDSGKMVRIETYLMQLFKLYENLTGKPHVRDVHRKTGLFDKIFLWPDLIPKGVTKEDIKQAYKDKIESIRTRADRKIKKAEEELKHWNRVLA